MQKPIHFVKRAERKRIASIIFDPVARADRMLQKILSRFVINAHTGEEASMDSMEETGGSQKNGRT